MLIQALATLICGIDVIIAIAQRYGSRIRFFRRMTSDLWYCRCCHFDFPEIVRILASSEFQETWATYLGFASSPLVGRVVIVLCMVNAVLHVGIFLPSSPLFGGGITAKVNNGFILAVSNPGSIGIATLALIVLTNTSLFVYLGTKRRRPPSRAGHVASSDIGLITYELPRAEGAGYTHLGDGQRRYGSL